MVFLTVFIDLIGFGIIVPLVPMFSRHYGASGWMIGVIIASFSAMQFIFSPVWGKLSDRHGRRPILLISTAGAALSYVLFAIGSGLRIIRSRSARCSSRASLRARAAATSLSRKPTSPTSRRRKTVQNGWDLSAWRSASDLFSVRPSAASR